MENVYADLKTTTIKSIKNISNKMEPIDFLLGWYVQKEENPTATCSVSENLHR